MYSIKGEDLFWYENTTPPTVCNNLHNNSYEKQAEGNMLLL